MSEVLQLQPGIQAPAQARHWLADVCQDRDARISLRTRDEMPVDLTVEGTAITGERGRGLQIVDAIANAWGVTVTATGKSVRFALWPTP